MTNLPTSDQWVHPETYGQTIEQRFARLVKYVKCYTGRNTPKTPGQKEQLKRYQSEARYLRDLQDGIS